MSANPNDTHENETDLNERIIEIELERLRDFRNHPFKVVNDQQMIQLQDSISRFGILNPLLVRPIPEGAYEIVSGHRRKYAAIQLGYRKLPVIIRYMKDEDAVISMVDSNLHRESICPSEKAMAYKMKFNAIRRKSGRKSGSQAVHNYYGRRSVEIIGEEAGESSKQVQRYLKITELIPELLEKLDKGEIAFNPAFEVAFLKEEEQRALLSAMEYTQASPSISQAQRMKKLSKGGGLSGMQMRTILSEVKKGDINRVMFKNEQLYRFFPREYSAERMKQEILEILKHWMEQGTGQGMKACTEGGKTNG